MDDTKAIAIVRKNKRNGQKNITVPKAIKSIQEYDQIEFSESKEGSIKIKKV